VVVVVGVGFQTKSKKQAAKKTGFSEISHPFRFLSAVCLSEIARLLAPGQISCSP
jgi:hypothetical protein